MEITDISAFYNYIESQSATLIYFSNDSCNVCKVLKPKVKEMLESEFPKMKFYYVDTNAFPEIAAQNRVFTIPTILIFFDGKESIRKSRYIGIEELRKEIERPYEIIFG